MSISTSALGEEKPSTISVQGEASIQSPPDQLTLQIAVVTEHRKSEVAASENAKTTDAVITSLKKIAGKQGRLRTIGYTLSPDYKYTKASGRFLAGYRAQNTVELKTGKLDLAGQFIDAASEAGANQIQRLEFGLADDLPLRKQALALAAKEAREKAESIANALNQEIVAVQSVNESSGGIQPIRHSMRAMAADAEKVATPIESGTLDVRGRVQVLFTIAPK